MKLDELQRMIDLYETEEFTIDELRSRFGFGRNKTIKLLKEALGDRYHEIAKRVATTRRIEGSRKTNTGRKQNRTLEWNAKIAAGNRGKRLSVATRAKIGEASRKIPREVRRKAVRKAIATKRASGYFEEWSKMMEQHRRKPGEYKTSVETKKLQSEIKKKAIAEGRYVSPMKDGAHLTESKRKISESTKQMWKRGAFWLGQGVFRSGLEKRVFDLIKNAKPDARHSFSISGGSRTFNFDACIPSTKLLIEVNGDYWHCNPAIYNGDHFDVSRGVRAQEIWDRDAVKKLAGETQGYQVITLWECDLNEMTDEQIMEAIEIAYESKER